MGDGLGLNFELGRGCVKVGVLEVVEDRRGAAGVGRFQLFCVDFTLFFSVIHFDFKCDVAACFTARLDYLVWILVLTANGFSILLLLSNRFLVNNFVCLACYDECISEFSVIWSTYFVCEFSFIDVCYQDRNFLYLC